MAYNHIELEQKWQKFWEENQTFQAPNPLEKGGQGGLAVSENQSSVSPTASQLLSQGALKPKKFILDMFPYPSGAGLHVGHPKGYTATDIVSRYYHARGFNVLHTMGWDAFGLPAENYAIKTGTHPAVTTAKNVGVFTEQLKSLGFSYDWDREINTTDPEYYKWTQWIFLELFKKGLAYEQDLPINYCPSCKTGLANEEVLADNTCDRCGTLVERRPIRQWVLKITEYADRLIEDLDGLDWPEGVKEMQRNWIGKSEGCEFRMVKSDDPTKSIEVYTTRVDTAYGMTYAVLAPDHPRVYDFITDEHSAECEAYITEAASRSDQDRTNEGKEKTGVFTGSYVVNPFNGESVPLWIADYVLGHYGTGAVMAVPAHDERDFAFAKRYKLPIRQSIAKEIHYTGANATKDGIETLQRVTVDVLLENKNGEFLLLQDKETGDFHFVGGGIENGESELEAVKRELTEETGYTDFDIVGLVNSSYSVGCGYRFTKGKNQRCLGGIFHARLQSDKRIDSEIESGKHGMNWFKKDEIKGKIGWDSHKDFWDAFEKGDRCSVQDGILCNSQEFTWLSSAEARKTLSEKAESEGFGRKKVNYKLRDWLFSRQRYWGEPIPLIHISNEDYDRLPRISDMSDTMEPGIAYIFDKRGTTKRCKNCNCDGNGCVKLIIDGKAFSKVYDGITGKIVIDSNLPLTLPEVEKYEPAGDGQSPLATVPSFVNVTLASNLAGKRETNTMPQWGGSCWYYLRYMDPKNTEALAGKEAIDYWQNVDEYVGGAEHAVLHLLYARFWHKVLYDIGVVPTLEPFQKLTNVGLILGPDGNKMSKSKGNVINPNDIVAEYGADTLRMYEMSMGAFTDAAPWNPDAIIGVRRFLDKAYALFEGTNTNTHTNTMEDISVSETKKDSNVSVSSVRVSSYFAKDDMKAMKLLHKTVKKVGEDIVEYKFNTAISALQILLNEGLPRDAEFAREWKEKFAIILHPFAPHMAEELFHLLEKGGAEERGGGLAVSGNSGNQSAVSPTASQSFRGGAIQSIYFAPWPSYDEFMLVDDEVTIAVQVGGKLRGTFTFLNGVGQEEVSEVVRADEGIKKWLEGKEIIKEIFIPNKMLSIVVK